MTRGPSTPAQRAGSGVAYHLVVAIERVLAEHLPDPNVRYRGQLVEDEIGRALGRGHVERNVLPKRSYCPVVHAELFMPAAQLGSPNDSAIAIMSHVSCVRSMHLK